MVSCLESYFVWQVQPEREDSCDPPLDPLLLSDTNIEA